MKFEEYQQETDKTDILSKPEHKQSGVNIIVPLLGLAGSSGKLLTEYKKRLRDGKSHLLFKDRIADELGDLLYNLSSVATKFHLSLEDIAKDNLKKSQEKLLSQSLNYINFDSGYPEAETFPLQFEVELKEVLIEGVTKLRTTVNGVQIGDDLTDNANDADGYRFHDVFHLSYVAVLGWSPVIRKLLNKKRKSNPKVDEVQDGGRAQIIDEAITALAFDYAKEHNWLKNVYELDFHLLKNIKGITSMLEVDARTMFEWQKAILMGFEVWREVVQNNGGKILVDMENKTLIYLSKD